MIGTAYDGFLYNKVQFHNGLSHTTWQYRMTDRVYVVKHGDGAKHSKVQILEIQVLLGAPTKDVITFKVENID